eukprot:1177044-Prorocentrum_minimum.AAC.1
MIKDSISPSCVPYSVPYDACGQWEGVRRGSGGGKRGGQRGGRINQAEAKQGGTEGTKSQQTQTPPHDHHLGKLHARQMAQMPIIREFLTVTHDSFDVTDHSSDGACRGTEKRSTPIRRVRHSPSGAWSCGIGVWNSPGC